MALITLTECANLAPTDELAWRLYLTGTYCTMAWLCAWLRPAWVAWSGVGIFGSQALDELVGGNLWAVGLWEYPLAAVFSLAVYLITRRKDDTA